MVWNCVQNHEGHIDVESSAEGTVFTLAFPMCERAPVQKKEALFIDELRGSGTVLVVDDEALQRDVAMNLLKELGYTVTAVDSGEEAVSYLQDKKVDLVLLDMIMDPGLSGFQTYEQILKIHPRQKALVVSGFSESNDVQQTLAIGAGGFIRKPYTMEELAKEC